VTLKGFGHAPAQAPLQSGIESTMLTFNAKAASIKRDQARQKSLKRI
jgi:hypothetical protein